MGRVDHDAEDPGTELPSRIVPVDVSPRREEAILGGIIGVLRMVEYSPRHPSRCRLVAPDQLAERLTVPLLCGHGQSGVGYLRTTQRATPMLNFVPWLGQLLDR